MLKQLMPNFWSFKEVIIPGRDQIQTKHFMAKTPVASALEGLPEGCKSSAESLAMAMESLIANRKPMKLPNKVRLDHLDHLVTPDASQY